MTLETANRLFELRKKHNLSQEELAEKLGVSRQAVSKWERSEASPDTDNLIALAKIYDLTLDELIFGEREDNNKEADESSAEETNEASDDEAKGDFNNIFINVDDGGDKVEIGPEGILVKEKNGNTVKINVKGKIMEKVFKKIEDKIDNCEIDDFDSDENSNDEDDELYETIYFTQGDIKGTDKKLHLKIKKATKFWMQIPYAVICTVAYLLCGFYNVLGGWALSWVIFVTIPIYYSLVEAIYKRRFSEFAYPVFCAFVYLVCGLYFGNWHPSWLIFITVAIYYPIADALDKVIRKNR